MCLYVCERKNNISFYVFLAFDQNFCVFFELHVWHFAPYYGLYMQNRGGFVPLEVYLEVVLVIQPGVSSAYSVLFRYIYNVSVVMVCTPHASFADVSLLFWKLFISVFCEFLCLCACVCVCVCVCVCACVCACVCVCVCDCSCCC